MNVPCSSTPAGPLPSTNCRASMLPSAKLTASAPARTVISGLNHTALPLAVYASQGELPHRHARLASGGWPALPSGAGYPPGSNETFQVIPFSSQASPGAPILHSKADVPRLSFWRQTLKSVLFCDDFREPGTSKRRRTKTPGPPLFRQGSPGRHLKIRPHDI